MKTRELAAFLVLTACGAPAEPEPEVVVAVPPPPPSEATASTPQEAPPPATPEPSSDELGPLDRARVENVRVETMSIAMAIELWQSSRPDQCPRFEDLVRDKVFPPDKPNEDPWGQPYSIQCTDQGPTVTSNGPDEKPGTPDDVTGPGS